PRSPAPPTTPTPTPAARPATRPRRPWGSRRSRVPAVRSPCGPDRAERPRRPNHATTRTGPPPPYLRRGDRLVCRSPPRPERMSARAVAYTAADGLAAWRAFYTFMALAAYAGWSGPTGAGPVDGRGCWRMRPILAYARRLWASTWPWVSAGSRGGA